MYYVKFGYCNGRSLYFLTPSGGHTRLKIHAVRFMSLDAAKDAVASIERDAPHFRARVVEG